MLVNKIEEIHFLQNCFHFNLNLFNSDNCPTSNDKRHTVVSLSICIQQILCHIFLRNYKRQELDTGFQYFTPSTTCASYSYSVRCCMTILDSISTFFIMAHCNCFQTLFFEMLREWLSEQRLAYVLFIEHHFLNLQCMFLCSCMERKKYYITFLHISSAKLFNMSESVI